MYLKTSRFSHNAVIEEIICSEERNLGKEMLLKLYGLHLHRQSLESS